MKCHSVKSEQLGLHVSCRFYLPFRICSCFTRLRPIVLCLQLKDEDVAIVKMDATNNDVPSPYEVHGFPTLYWAPKDAKDSPVRYEVSSSAQV
jgi:protein disulfide isomerase family A protein 3